MSEHDEDLKKLKEAAEKLWAHYGPLDFDEFRTETEGLEIILRKKEK